MKNRGVIKEKANFIKENAVKLYYFGSYKFGESKNTMEENLISILLSDKALGDCPRYEELNNALRTIDIQTIAINPDKNYPLLTIFSAVQYVNASVRKDETGEELRDRMRKYLRFIDSSVTSTSHVVKFHQKEEQAKTKVKSGV